MTLPHDDEEIEPTYPAQAQFLVLRAVSVVCAALATDLADDDKRGEVQGLFNQGELSGIERMMVTRALQDLGTELRVRANQTWDANAEYLSAVIKMAELRN